MLKKIMKIVSPYISSLSLIVILGFAVARFMGNTTMEIYIWWTTLSTIVWFVFSPFWLVVDKDAEK